jgi:hypothetical protein
MVRIPLAGLTIYRTVHRKLKIDQHEPNKKSGVISGAPERQAVLAPPMTPINK